MASMELASAHMSQKALISTAQELQDSPEMILLSNKNKILKTPSQVL
jgi:hypothetical protein